MPTLSFLKNTLLIVLYKSSIMGATTVTSLLKANTDGVQLKIIIWNNGPNLLSQDDINIFEHECNTKGISFEIYQDVRNISLSYIYNFCISKNNECDYFTILDQDSVLADDFLTNIAQHASYDLICPRISPANEPTKQKWPANTVLKQPISEGEFDLMTFFTVGSGLSLSRSLHEKLADQFGTIFCEDYVLYNVDAELYRQINQLNDITAYCGSSMLHSESGSEKKKPSEVNKLEWGLMKVIFRIKKKRKNLLQNLLYICWFALKTRCAWDSFIKLIACAKTKVHPRAIYTIPADFKPDFSNDPRWIIFVKNI